MTFKSFPKKTRVIIFVIGAVISLTVINYLAYKTNEFFTNNELKYHSPIAIQFHKLITIEKRVWQIVNVNEIVDAHASPLTPDQQYLCDKFGPNCKMALAIQHAENGTGECGRMGFNYGADGKVSSVDFGFMQINSVHIKKGAGWTPADLMDCHKNIDDAYEIFKQSGFGPWSTYQSKAYLKFMY